MTIAPSCSTGACHTEAAAWSGSVSSAVATVMPGSSGTHRAVEWPNGECSAEADHVGGGDGDRDRRIRARTRDSEHGLRHRQAVTPPIRRVVTGLLQHRQRGGAQDDACRGFDVEAGDFAEQRRGDTLALHL